MEQSVGSRDGVDGHALVRGVGVASGRLREGSVGREVDFGRLEGEELEGVERRLNQVEVGDVRLLSRSSESHLSELTRKLCRSSSSAAVPSSWCSTHRRSSNRLHRRRCASHTRLSRSSSVPSLRCRVSSSWREELPRSRWHWRSESRCGGREEGSGDALAVTVSSSRRRSRAIAGEVGPRISSVLPPTGATSASSELIWGTRGGRRGVRGSGLLSDGGDLGRVGLLAHGRGGGLGVASEGVGRSGGTAVEGGDGHAVAGGRGTLAVRGRGQLAEAIGGATADGTGDGSVNTMAGTRERSLTGGRKGSCGGVVVLLSAGGVLCGREIEMVSADWKE